MSFEVMFIYDGEFNNKYEMCNAHLVRVNIIVKYLFHFIAQNDIFFWT